MNNPERSAKDSRKQAVSIRMNRSDVRNIKRLAQRLGARDSDVIRFAIKLMLSRLAPLPDPSVSGRNLVPVFIESGPELIRHFEIDAAKLASIINEGADEDARVEVDDIHLLVMSGIQRSYLKLRMRGIRRDGMTEGGAEGISGITIPGGRNGSDGESIDQSLRQYLVEKYVFRQRPTGAVVGGK